jgi:hypothetical protein
MFPAPEQLNVGAVSAAPQLGLYQIETPCPVLVDSVTAMAWSHPVAPLTVMAEVLPPARTQATKRFPAVVA